MNSYLLLDDLKKHLTESLKDHLLRLPKRTESYGPPKIYIGQLPARTGSIPNQVKEDESDVPFVLIRSPTIEYFGADNTMDCNIDISIIVGIHSAESERESRGIEDLLNLMDKIVIDLSSKLYWGDEQFKKGDSVKCTLGAPKESGPYDAGLQEFGSNFAGVIQMSFNRLVTFQQKPLIHGTY